MKKKLLTATALVVIGFYATAQTIFGIDVSNYQGAITWSSVKAGGVTFAWAKATEGLTVTDSEYSNNAVNGVAAGVYMGAYHFAHPDTHTTTAQAIAEANFFLSVAQPYIVTCELPPVLDYEVNSSLSWAAQTTWIQDWMNTVKTATGITPILYTSGSIANSLGSSLASYCKLWIATDNGYTVTTAEVIPPSPLPPTPSTYDQGSWYPNFSFNQYSWTTNISGISGAIDADIFNGTLADLKNLMTCTPPVCHTYYATVPYTKSFETAWLTDSCANVAQRLPDIYWKSSIGGTTPNGNDYWHAEDYTGSDWTSVTTGSYTPASSAGNHSARFHNDPPPAGSTGALDLYIDLSASGAKTIQFDYIHDEASVSPFAFNVLLSTDGGSTFPTTLFTITGTQVSSWTTQTFTTSATSATSVLRFIATDKGAHDVGIDNLSVSLGATTGIGDIVGSDYQIKVYPNPNTGEFIIAINDASKKASVEVYNNLGQFIKHQDANNGENTIHIADLSEGVYFANIFVDGIKTSTQKILVIK